MLVDERYWTRNPGGDVRRGPHGDRLRNEAVGDDVGQLPGSRLQGGLPRAGDSRVRTAPPMAGWTYGSGSPAERTPFEICSIRPTTRRALFTVFRATSRTSWPTTPKVSPPTLEGLLSAELRSRQQRARFGSIAPPRRMILTRSREIPNNCSNVIGELCRMNNGLGFEYLWRDRLEVDDRRVLELRLDVPGTIQG